MIRGRSRGELARTIRAGVACSLLQGAPHRCHQGLSPLLLPRLSCVLPLPPSSPPTSLPASPPKVNELSVLLVLFLLLLLLQLLLLLSPSLWSTVLSAPLESIPVPLASFEDSFERSGLAGPLEVPLGQQPRVSSSVNRDDDSCGRNGTAEYHHQHGNDRARGNRDCRGSHRRNGNEG